MQLSITQLKMSSILDQFPKEEIDKACDSLVKKGLVDNKEQALLNLEMDLEERQQLATGG